jgi:hypothetical protein
MTEQEKEMCRIEFVKCAKDVFASVDSVAVFTRIAFHWFYLGWKQRAKQDRQLSPGDDGSTAPIEDVLADIAKTVPQDEWDKLPADVDAKSPGEASDD